MRAMFLALSLALLIPTLPAYASTAYGSLNNFDVVNDTGVPCHGFEIEIEDVHSRDITYTYDWNHYGTPKITEDNSDSLHPKVIIRYASARNPDGSWAAYTAVPSGPIAPTDGHQFIDPTVNFGGEHFGVGFYGAPTTVRYFWLIDDGAGNLIRGPAVNIATPTFTYYPPLDAAPAQVQAAIQPPDPPEIPVLEFGEAMWVKVTRTQTHNNNFLELRDLVTDDPDDPNDESWAHGEPDEVEVEWQLLQTEFNKPDGGAFGELLGEAEELPEGDEIITRRYDFFKYVGPIDAETGEALCDSVGPDDLHGEGVRLIDSVEVDLATLVVVGDYIGAQMAGFDPAGQLGLIDHVQEGEVNVPYVERTIVVGGTAPVETTRTGALPDGMQFNDVTGVLSGTPTVSGLFTFTIHSTDAAGGDVTQTYDLNILEAPSTVVTSASPVNGGTTSGGGEFANGTLVTVVATANAGFAFVNWTENGGQVSTSASYQFQLNGNRTLVANFVRTYTVSTSAAPLAGGSTSGGGTFNSGTQVTVQATANPGYQFVYWTENGAEASTSTSYQFTLGADRTLVANFSQIPSTVYRNVADLVTVSEGGKTTTLNRLTRKLTSVSQVTITNNSGETIEAPMRLLVKGVQAGVAMPEASGQTQTGDYYYDLQGKLGLTSLAPGQAAKLTIKFVYPMTLRVSYRLEFWGTAAEPTLNVARRAVGQFSRPLLQRPQRHKNP